MSMRRLKRKWGILKEWYCDKTSHDWIVTDYSRKCTRCGMRGSRMVDRSRAEIYWVDESMWWF